MTQTRSRSISMPSVACTTFIDVRAASKSTSRLSWLGSRCCTITKAMPFRSGSASNSFLQASRPPAEAPIATIGNFARPLTESGVRIQRGRSTVERRGRLPDILLFFSKRGSHRGDPDVVTRALYDSDQFGGIALVEQPTLLGEVDSDPW